MLRTGLVLLAIVVGSYVLINLLVTTDLEHVEHEVERLLDLAREGGDGAVEEILGAFADDYRGSVPLETIERHLRNYVGGRKIRSLKTGSYKVVWKPDGKDIWIPLLAVYAELEGWTAKFILSVTCGEREGGWKVVVIERVRWG